MVRSFRISSGKVIRTAYTSPDFAPTILSLMRVDHKNIQFQGIDATEEIFHHWKWSISPHNIYLLEKIKAIWIFNL